MADLKAKRRAGKLLELTGESFYNPETDKYINVDSYDKFGDILYEATKHDPRVHNVGLLQDEMEFLLDKWDTVPGILRPALTPIVQHKLKSELYSNSKEGIKNLLLAAQAQQQTPSHRPDVRNFVNGLVQRIPQIPQRVPPLIDQIRNPSDIDKLGDLKNYLLQQMQRRR